MRNLAVVACIAFIASPLALPLGIDAADQATRVQELDGLIDRFLADTGATYPRANPAYQPAAAKSAATPDDPLEGWKARQCVAVVQDGVLTMTGTGNIGTAFLGHGMGRLSGPITVQLRVRAAAGGPGRIEWLPNGAGDPTGSQSVPFDVPAGDWQTLSLHVPAKGPLGVLRLYLPASEDRPADLDWIEVRGPASGAAPQRWEFAAPNAR